MKKGLFILSIIMVFTTIFNINVKSQDWNYIGHAKLNNETIFYVFTQKKTPTDEGNIQLLQKHKFNKPQTLSDGREYDSLLIDRTLNCMNKSISIDKIVITNGIGNKVDTYRAKNNTEFKKIESKNSLDLNIYKQYCK